jgi:membrane protein DedA with SNARE-associated domain
MLVLASISESVVNATAHLVRDGGLPAVFLLMALSCACIPVPSEVVLLFAGFAVADPSQSAAQHEMTIIGVVIAAMAGSMVGSWAAWGVGRGGRIELLHQHGAKLHIGPAQIDRADRFFQRYGDATVLFGRLIPFVRAFVSLPAGISGMGFWRFSILTFIGSLPWVVAITLAGHAVGSDWTSVRSGFEYVDYVVVAAIVAGLGYVLFRRRTRGAAGSAPGADAGADVDVDVPAGEKLDVLR